MKLNTYEYKKTNPDPDAWPFPIIYFDGANSGED